MKVFYRVLLVLAIAFSLVFVPVTRAHASTLTVTNNGDSGAGSLRAVITSAASGDTITFDNDYSITLASELVIDKTLMISGAEHSITLNGNHQTRIFNLASGTLVLDHLTLADGAAGTSSCPVNNCGGAVFVSTGASLYVMSSTFSGNTAGAIGGAIAANVGTVTVTSSFFSGNSSSVTSGFGGAIGSFDSSISITNSTFYRNSSLYGGAITLLGGSLAIRNNTFFENTAEPGQGGSLSLLQSVSVAAMNNLLVSNSHGSNCYGGLSGLNNLADDNTCGTAVSSAILLGPLGDYGGGTQTIPLLPGSPAIDAGNDAACAALETNNLDQRGVSRLGAGAHCDIGAYESRGFTLVKTGGDNQSTPIDTNFSNPLALTVTAVDAGAPVNGGKITFTAPGSGASILSAPFTLTIAGGAVSQSVKANVNEGAYTVTASTAGAVANASFSLTNTCQNAMTVVNNSGSGTGSLNQAVAGTCPGGVIDFSPSLAGSTITLANPLVVNRSLTINGLTTSPGVIISGNHFTRVFDISAGTVIINNLTIQDGINAPAKFFYLGGSGLYIANPGTAVTLNNCAVINNGVSGNISGGGIVVDTGSSLTMNNCTVSGNSADDAGGIVNLGTLTLNNSTVVKNTAAGIPGSVGGLKAPNGSTTRLQNTILAGNTSFFPGAGDCSTIYGSIQSSGYNLLGNTTGCQIATLTSDVTGFDFSALKLGPLQDNGGPTPTHALLASSPAIDAVAGCGGAPAVDQRGTLRPQGKHCDAGAFELVDAAGPETRIDSMDPAEPLTNSGSITFVFGGSDETSGIRSYECALDSGDFSACASPQTFSHLADGSHTLQVRAVDFVGNIDLTPASYTWTVDLLKWIYLPILFK